jgi:hypothetical protein
MYKDRKGGKDMCTAKAFRLSERIGLMLFVLTALVLLGYPQGASAARRLNASVQISFGDYEYLSDYGEWMEVPHFGMVWHPYVIEEWEPFYHGHWSWTTDGWAWISYEPFGWLVYHYGYWYHRPHIGWFWVPGNIWSPARVEWYTYGDYCAWAPLPPPHYYWPDPWDRHDGNIWVVVNINHFTEENIGSRRIAGPLHRETTRRDDWAQRAPSVRQVETATNRQIPKVRISREQMETRPETPKAPTRYIRPREASRTKMILPEQELNKVKQHAPQVEREVLVPRKSAPREQQQQRPVERRSGETQKSKARRR